MNTTTRGLLSLFRPHNPHNNSLTPYGSSRFFASSAAASKVKKGADGGTPKGKEGVVAAPKVDATKWQTVDGNYGRKSMIMIDYRTCCAYL